MMIASYVVGTMISPGIGSGKLRGVGSRVKARDASLCRRAPPGRAVPVASALLRMSQALVDTQAAADSTRALPSVRGAWLGLVVLTLINLFNYLDRFVVAALGESLRASELHLSDAQFGQLASVFILVYMVAAP